MQLFDNSGTLQLVAEIRMGEVLTLNFPAPEWVEKYLYANTGKIENWYKAMEEANTRTLAFIDKNAAGKKPFYIALWPQGTAFLPFPEKKTGSAGFPQKGLARLDVFIGQLMDKLKKLGIAENTLVHLNTQK